MFDFFRDMAQELMGKNSEEAEDKEKREMEYKKHFVFSKSTKTIVFAFGILYLLIGGMSLFANKQIEENMIRVSGHINIFKYIKYGVLSTIDIAAMVCLSIGQKKTEIAAVILVILFMVLMYVSSMMIVFL